MYPYTTKKFEGMAGNWGRNQLSLYSYGGKGCLLEKIILRVSAQKGYNVCNFFYGGKQKKFQVSNEIDYDHDNAPMVSLFKISSDEPNSVGFTKHGWLRRWPCR